MFYTGGGTNTHIALDVLTNQMFHTQNGARARNKGVPRVAVVLTDGRSNKPPLTVVNALRAHNADITMFAVGIGKSESI